MQGLLFLGVLTRLAYNVTSIFNSICYVRVKVTEIVFLTVISGNYSHNEKKSCCASLEVFPLSSSLLLLHTGEGGGGLPGSRLARRDFIQHLVNLFKSKTLGFGNKEVSVDNAEGAKSTPEEEDAGLHVGILGTDQVGSDITDDEVPEPVGGSGKGDTTGTDGEREDFTNKNPGTGTPGGGKEEDVDGNESNLGVDSGYVVGDGDTINNVGVVETNSDTDGTDNEFTDSHTDGTPEKHGATTEAFDKPEG